MKKWTKEKRHKAITQGITEKMAETNVDMIC